VISSQQLQKLVRRKAEQISCHQREEVERLQGVPLPPLAQELDLYDAHAEEVLFFEDGILVKGQKKYRRSKNREAASKAGQGKRPCTDVALLMGDPAKAHYLIGGIGSKAVDLAQVLRAHLLQQQPKAHPVAIVALTDGASQIQGDFMEAFGVAPIRILDWFHLKKKVDEMCRMICFGKERKAQAVKQILRHLWVGQLGEAIDYLKNQVQVRNEAKHKELLGYLEKHQAAIIDYKRRKECGKTIGSGCIESAVKKAVAIRQKSRGMSWSPTGSTALAILTVQYMNGQWKELWGWSDN
jgi:hypothetical protein